jgi:hypothetical protein
VGLVPPVCRGRLMASIAFRNQDEPWVVARWAAPPGDRVAEAARLLRPGGHLVFPADGPCTRCACLFRLGRHADPPGSTSG